MLTAQADTPSRSAAAPTSVFNDCAVSSAATRTSHFQRSDLGEVGYLVAPTLSGPGVSGGRKSEQRRRELPPPAGRAGIIAAHHLEQVDESLTGLLIGFRPGQQFGQFGFHVVGWGAGPDEGQQTTSLTRLGESLQQCDGLIRLASVDEKCCEAGDRAWVVTLDIERGAQRTFVAGRHQLVDLTFLRTGHEPLHELTHGLLGLGPHESVDHFAIDHRVDRRDRLHLECRSHLGIGIDINLGQLDCSLSLGDNALDHRSQLFAGPTPGSPEVDHHGDGSRPLHNCSFKCRIGYICHDPLNVTRTPIIPSITSQFAQTPSGVLQCRHVDRQAGRRMSQSLEPDDLYTLLHTPDLHRPVMLVHFDGWIDSGQSASTAIKHVIAQIDAKTVAAFDAELLIDHRARRPIMHLVDGVNTGIEWPKIELVAGRDGRDNDILVLSGAEPDHNWRSFTAASVELAERFGVRRMVGLGAYPAAVPHTRPCRLSVTASTPELAKGDYANASLDVPAGVESAMEKAFQLAGIESLGLWAQVPHYILNAPYPSASLALIEALERTAGIRIDPGALVQKAIVSRTRLDELVASDDSHAEMIADLERRQDESSRAELEMESSDQLSEEIERFLREQNDD